MIPSRELGVDLVQPLSTSLDPAKLLPRLVEPKESLVESRQLAHAVLVHRVVSNFLRVPLQGRPVSKFQFSRDIQVRMDTLVLFLDAAVELLLGSRHSSPFDNTKLAPA